MLLGSWAILAVGGGDTSKIVGVYKLDKPHFLLILIFEILTTFLLTPPPLSLLPSLPLSFPLFLLCLHYWSLQATANSQEEQYRCHGYHRAQSRYGGVCVLLPQVLQFISYHMLLPPSPSEWTTATGLTKAVGSHWERRNSQIHFDRERLSSHKQQNGQFQQFSSGCVVHIPALVSYYIG